MMVDRPIIMSAPMVRALLDGNKTQTRRLAWRAGHTPLALGGMAPVRKPTIWQKVQAGDRLWCREAWQDYCPLWKGHWCGHGSKESIAAEHQPVYKADPAELWLRGPSDKQQPPLKWRSSIHMPRWASRLTLIVTEVRQERVQDISETDAISEGIDGTYPDPGSCKWRHPTEDRGTSSASTAFGWFWETLHTKPGATWDDNPWICALTFTVHKCNIDRMEARTE